MTEGWLHIGYGTPIYIADMPRCPTHGQMHAEVFVGVDKSSDGSESVAHVISYTCAGYDGEGCDYTAPPEYRLVGYTAGEVHWELP